MEPSTAPVVASVPRRAKAAPWDQQQGENDLWYARFLRFVALGPGRSVSLVATGRRNAYPVPAHWPIQAKQRSWRERARAFDLAAHNDPSLIRTFNDALSAFLASVSTSHNLNGEVKALSLSVEAGGYHSPPEDDEYLDEDELSASGH